MSKRFLFILIAFIALLGTVNAGYLAWTATLGEAPTCLLNSGCDIVAASSYSKVLGIPLASFGVFFYAMIFGFALWRVLVPTAPALTYIFPLASLGFLLSLYFLYLQVFAIGAYCEYCLFSLFDATVLFAIALYLWLQDKNQGTLRQHTDYGSV